jgi:hypothetical protein
MPLVVARQRARPALLLSQARASDGQRSLHRLRSAHVREYNCPVSGEAAIAVRPSDQAPPPSTLGGACSQA